MEPWRNENQMSKKKSSKLRRTAKRRPDKKSLIGVVAIVIVLTCATMAGIWRNSAGVRRFRAVFLPSASVPIPSPGNPSKEYIYAGGKLVATEAPVTLVAPGGLEATTVSNLYPAAAQITVSWQETQGAHHYQVEKTTNVNTAYSSVNSNVAGLSLTDTAVTSDPVTAYLYRVRAVDANGNVSPYSNVDVATAISFEDDNLIPNTTLVKASHITQLRQAVNAVRAVTATLGPVDWGGGITQNVTEIQATHIDALRTNLDQARSALLLSACSYSDNSVAALRASYFKKEHIDQIRNCVK